MNETVNLSGVPETMLQTVYARAKETRTRGAIHDDKAVELVEKLHYDFSLADKDAAMSSGVIARTIVLDHLVQDYLATHSGAVVVNIACGLDTRCYRMQGYTHWYNLICPKRSTSAPACCRKAVRFLKLPSPLWKIGAAKLPRKTPPRW